MEMFKSNKDGEKLGGWGMYWILPSTKVNVILLGNVSPKIQLIILEYWELVFW